MATLARRCALGCVGAAVLALALPLTAQRPRQRPPQAGRARDMTAFTMLRDDGFPLNVDPEIVPAEQAGLEPGDMVMGVVIGGEARAYPVNYMNGPFNEVVNDVLGGTPIAPSW